MYSANRFLFEPAPEQVTMSIKTIPEGPRVLTRALTGDELEVSKQNRARARLSDSAETLEPQAIPESAPSEAKTLSRMLRLGIPEAQARDAIEKLGTVKLTAILERELEKANLKASSAATTSAPSEPAPVSPAESVSEAEPAKDPYQDLAVSYAANPPFQSEEEVIAHRQERFNQYLETVKNAENELFINNENGLACTGENCLPAH